MIEKGNSLSTIELAHQKEGFSVEMIAYLFGGLHQDLFKMILNTCLLLFWEDCFRTSL